VTNYDLISQACIKAKRPVEFVVTEDFDQRAPSACDLSIRYQLPYKCLFAAESIGSRAAKT
jgi:hypothetical protein